MTGKNSLNTRVMFPVAKLTHRKVTGREKKKLGKFIQGKPLYVKAVNSF